MADSLKTRVGRVIAGSAHALVDRLENQAPQAVMEQSVREVQTIIGEVRHELGLVSANRHLTQQQHSSLNGQHAKLDEQTQQALASGREDLVRAAVARQLDIEAQIPVLEAALAELARKEEELTGYVAATSSANAQQRLESATDSFDRLYQRHTGLTPTGVGATLDQASKLKDLEELVRQNKINERMAQLRNSQS